MSEPPDDDSGYPSQRPSKPPWGSHPTVKSFPAVRPDGKLMPIAAQAKGEDAAPESAGPTRGELTLAVMMLAEQVEHLGGDVSEVRYLLGMTKRDADRE